jgi:hypothetical protein
VRRQRWRQVAPCGHESTVGQRILQLVLRDDWRSGAEHPVRHWRGEPYPYGSGAIGLDCAPVRAAGDPQPAAWCAATASRRWWRASPRGGSRWARWR